MSVGARTRAGSAERTGCVHARRRIEILLADFLLPEAVADRRCCPFGLTRRDIVTGLRGDVYACHLSFRSLGFLPLIDRSVNNDPHSRVDRASAFMLPILDPVRGLLLLRCGRSR